jgi:hypothetical protein
MQSLRICFLGDSHIASVKLGWLAVKEEFPSVTAAFFAAPVPELQNTAIEDGRLVAKTDEARRWLETLSEGSDVATFAEFDLVVVVGAGFGMEAIAAVYSACRTLSHKNRQGEFQLVSDAYFREIVALKLANGIGFRHADTIRAGVNPNVWLLPQPMPGTSILRRPSPTLKYPEADMIIAVKAAAEWGDEASLFGEFTRAMSDLRNKGWVIFEQPADTRTGEIFTKEEFSIGAVRVTSGLDVPYPETDYRHRNARYGELVMRDILHRALEWHDQRPAAEC